MAPKENPIAHEDEEDIPGDEEPIEGDEKPEEDEEELVPGKALEEDEKEDPKDKSRTAHHVISSAIPFLFKFVRFSNGKDSANEGSLPSSKMGAVDTTTLGALRPKIPVMSPKSHTFCLQDGTAVRDDTTVAEYFDMDHQVVSSSTPTPAVTIRFKSHRDKTHSAASAAADKTERLEKLHKLQEDLAKLGPDHTFTDHTAQELKRKVQLLDTEERIDAAAYKPSEMTSSK
ncbi:hypothetical protein Q9L58_006105 [Maublancomyces gigas]|uniref:Ubiquitin-like domain-containing protein n=1 Tax=Discina gigas TaxID=1032678 RepID=A0ABR3GG91_9PEZI